jgi:hypothetical protein
MNMPATYFNEVESDFYRYLTGPGGVNRHSRTNYMAWLKFISESYPLPADLTESDIDGIMASEESLRTTRDKYKTPRDMINFRSALRKYRSFLSSDFRHQQEETILAEAKKVANDKTITKTERTAITRARVGQGLFRERLIDFWHGCSISAFPHYDILTASHIKPWRVSDNNQRLDVFNGLLLLPNFDRLFDKGYISFSNDGKIIFSRYLGVSDRVLLGIDETIHLLKINDAHKPYLQFHRENCLMS